MNIFGHQNKKGFTLIELLVVISIISLLATLAVASLQNARMKSRDARRLSDITNIRKAFELFYDENEKYDGPVYLGGDKRISSIDFNPYLNESNVYDPLTDPSESLASAVQCLGNNTLDCNYAVWRVPQNQHYLFYIRLEGATSLGNSGSANCLITEKEIICANNVSYSYCSNVSSGDPKWPICYVYDYNNNGTVSIADYTAYDN